mmetsp:Transcript_15454/g.37424  ORF Transcript_15454/g.37424 Transcript_15454/m.37424 type:complete len:267 (-) Transcript_15454:694-1494(-)
MPSKRPARWCMLCGTDECLNDKTGRSVRHQPGEIYGSYWVGHVLTGTKLSGQIYLPSTEVHKADRRDGTVGWVCDKSWQKGTNSDVHRGRARLPNPAAGLDDLNAGGGSRLRSESAAAARAAHRVTSDATDEVERLEAAAATAREEELQREAASVAAAEVAAARVEALQSQVDAMHAKLDAEQQLVVKLQRQLVAHAETRRGKNLQTGTIVQLRVAIAFSCQRLGLANIRRVRECVPTPALPHSGVAQTQARRAAALHRCTCPPTT